MREPQERKNRDYFSSDENAWELGICVSSWVFNFSNYIKYDTKVSAM